jgi:hypothetical protein
MDRTGKALYQNRPATKMMLKYGILAKFEVGSFCVRFFSIYLKRAHLSLGIIRGMDGFSIDKDNIPQWQGLTYCSN